MHKIIRVILSCFILLLCLFLILNLTVTTKQGVNYELRTIKLPLYLKLLDFFDRHYNYEHLVKNIVKNSKNDEDRVIALLKWTYDNIRKNPQGLAVVDDHVWYVIVRGYGVEDQFSDVFSTLCNYAGFRAFYSWIESSKTSSRMAFSFVKLKGKWFVFDPYRGVYFIDSAGRLADTNMLENTKGGWMVSGNFPMSEPVDYTSYFKSLSLLEYDGLGRSNIQSPLRRIIFQMKKSMFIK